MRKNKVLKNSVDEILSNYDNKEFFEELKTKVDNNAPVKSNNTFRYSFIGALSSIAIVLIVCLSVFIPKFINKDNKNEEEPLFSYTSENIYKVSYEDVDFDSYGISLLKDDLMDIRLEKDDTHDKNLLYYIDYHFNDFIESIRLNMIVEKNFEYNFVHFEYNKEYYIGVNKIDYCEKIEEIEEGIYHHVADGYMKNDKIEIYFNYEGYSYDIQDQFTSIIDLIFIN